MRSSSFGFYYPAAFLTLAIFSGCKKGEEAPPASTISPPPQQQTRSSSQIKPEAEVVATNGPIQLTLRLHRTRIKLGDSLWHQIGVRNSGDKDLLLVERIFYDPWFLRDNFNAKTGIYIEILGPDGKSPPMRHPDINLQGDFVRDRESGLLSVEGPQEQAMVERWEGEGLSDQAIKYKLIEYNTKKQQGLHPAPSDWDMILLKPGESIETKSWFYHGFRDRVILKKPAPEPIGDYAETEVFYLKEPGRYRVRAVYKNAPSKAALREYGKMGLPTYGDVNVNTPWVEIKVSR